MKTSRNSASWNSFNFGSLSCKEKPPSTTKHQYQHDTVKADPNTIIPSRFTTSTLMVADHQRIGIRILDHLRKRERREPLTIDQIIIVREGACQVEVEAVAEAHSSLCIVCIMTSIHTIKERLSNFPRIQKENRPRSYPVSATILVQESQSHNAVATISSTMFSIISFVIFPANPTK
jgi:hypothetical protein